MNGLIFEGDKKLGWYDFEIPSPGEGEVLIKVSKAAICGTDLHKYQLPSDQIPRTKLGEPIPCGHEPAGWIAALGKGATGFQKGQRVMVAGVIGCGTCNHCLLGFNTACIQELKGLYWNYPGCNTSFIVMPEANVILLPDNISFEVASLLSCAGGTAMTIIEDSNIKPGDKLAIIGLGSVGLCLVVIALSKEIEVVGIDVSEYRLELAKKLGITKALHQKNENVPQKILEWSQGSGCDVVAECVGLAATQKQSFDLVANRGTIALAGLGNEDFNANLGALTIDKGGIKLIGIAATPILYFRKLLKIASKLNFEKIITHRFPFVNAEKAFRVMEEGNCGKVILEIEDLF